MYKLNFKKVEEPEIKLPASLGSQKKKKENSRKTSTSALLTILKSLCRLQQTGKFSKRWEHQTTLPVFLRNLYEGQEGTVKTGHGTMDWFTIGKGVCQACILSPCLFNFYAKYIM